MADSDWITITEKDEWETIPEGGFRGAGAGGTWKELTPIQKAGQAVKETVAAPVRTIESMAAGGVGGLMRMGAEAITIERGFERARKYEIKFNAITGKHFDMPGISVIGEHLVRKYGFNRANDFYDRKIKKLADAGQKISDFWNEQANKGWEAPNPNIVEARWSERPVSKTVSAVSSGLTSIGVVVGATALTKSPHAGLAILAASETGGMYDRLRNKNVSPDVASKLALMAGAWTYVTEKIGFEKLLKPTSRTIMAALKKGGWEGAQEVVEQVGHNLLEYFGYDYKRPQDIPTATKAAFDHAMDGWVDALVGGIGAGGIAHLALRPGVRPGEPGEPITTPPTVEELTKKPIEEIEPQTPDHAIGHQYGLSNEQIDNKLEQAELKYRELKLKDVTERTPAETDELAFLSRNRTNIEAILERETRPVTPPPVKRTQKNLLALGHKIARQAELSDEEYRDFAEIITGKRSMGDMSKAERNEFVTALEEAYGTPKELLPEDYDMPIQVAGRGTTMREDYNKVMETIDKLENRRKIPSIVRMGFEKVAKPIQAVRDWLFGISNTPPYHLAKILDGGKEDIFSLVFDKDVQRGGNIKKGHRRAVMTALMLRLEELGMTDNDLAKMGQSVNPRLRTYQMINKGAAPEILTESINGRDYEITWAELIHTYLYSIQEGGMQHLLGGGLVIRGIETGKISEERVSDIQRKVEENPKAMAVVNTILEIGEQIWKPSINQVSQRTEGKDLATEPNWFGLRVWKPRRLAGKIRMGKKGPREINLVEERGIWKDRTHSTLPLIVGDVFNEFATFENAISEYVGMAETYRSVRTLLNDSNIVRALDQKGYSPVYDRIRRIYKRASESSTPLGSVDAWFEKHLPALYRAVVHFNARLVTSQATSTWNYGAFVSAKYMPTALKNGFSIKAIQRTMRLSNVAWDRFYMAHTSLEMGEAAHADAALRMWTGGKSADINKAGYAAKVGDATALAGGMEVAWLEYADARKGTIDGLSAEWWVDKDDLPDINIDKWEETQEAGEDASSEERQAAEQWRQLVVERAEYLWQRSQPSWDKENRSDLTSQRGFAKSLYMFRSFHEKSLTIFNGAKLEYHHSSKTVDDKMKFARRTGPVLAGYVVNSLIRAAIMMAITRKAKEPIKYFEEAFTSWMSMFPIFGRVLRQAVTRFIDTLADAKPTYTGEPLDPYPIQIINTALKSPTDMAEAMAHFVEGDMDEAEDALFRGVNKLVEGVGTLEGIPVHEAKRYLPEGEKESTGPTARGPRRRRGPAGRRPG